MTLAMRLLVAVTWGAVGPLGVLYGWKSKKLLSDGCPVLLLVRGWLHLLRCTIDSRIAMMCRSCFRQVTAFKFFRIVSSYFCDGLQFSQCWVSLADVSRVSTYQVLTVQSVADQHYGQDPVVTA